MVILPNSKIQPVNSKLPLRTLGVLLFTYIGLASAAPLVKSSDHCKNLPPVIGRENQSGDPLFSMDCDTVFVRKNDTTIVRPGTFLYFANPTLNSTIKVEGTMIVQGNDKAAVTFCGSIVFEDGTWKPSKKPWGGIEVAEGGTLVLDHATFVRAPTPIITFSKQVRIKKCFFDGSSGIILSNGSLLAMESKGEVIDSLVLSW